MGPIVTKTPHSRLTKCDMPLINSSTSRKHTSNSRASNWQHKMSYSGK